MSELRAQGLSHDGIATVLNAMGIKTRSGKAQWYAKTVREVLLGNKIPGLGTITVCLR